MSDLCVCACACVCVCAVESVMSTSTNMYVRHTLPLEQARSAMKAKQTTAAVVVDDNFKVRIVTRRHIHTHTHTPGYSAHSPAVSPHQIPISPDLRAVLDMLVCVCVRVMTQVMGVVYLPEVEDEMLRRREATAPDSNFNRPT